MDLILRFDVLQTEVLWMVNIEQKYQKRKYLREKGLTKIENPYLNTHLHINMNSHIYIQENPSSGLGGVAITNFF